ncbi:crotonobetainyl-CoA:carnitine CoA-transferase CaiB-like acyl-CoA transferase [Thermocatellispora tengchongensis]|uniref:Crotonobetainyl-CoA:carnitine CoA-transferase CaiB-like acyl-CoA transferase n=1 Tax=Thermocatellispora tengchongensis TaxID=1073253 RepID=A0A840PJR6_9ACTN|nr:CaiB/BaiF CoA-transferase family protein [Thermocatellispora tengchongensis]MBB5137820.1 crotonobetainyl-CoA:carnitine CoA-transferase CaiB-like acyl-CoA transferase [Thermocatellispora tengchongensis]
MTAGPLDGIRVVNLSETVPGPLAALLLADLGAEVITVERPPPGDPARIFPAVFAALSRNQRSVSLDLRDHRGLALFLRLAGTADAVITGQRPQVARKLGVHPDQLRARFPDLCVVSVSSFGLAGPYASHPGHDLVFQALAGLLDGVRPRAGAVPVIDIVSGFVTAIGALAALAGRARGRAAVTVETAMRDSALTLNLFALTRELAGLPGNATPVAPAGYDVYPLDDGTRLCLAVSYEAHHWRALCEALDLPELSAVTFEERVARREELNTRLAGRLRELTAGEVRARIAGRGVPAEPVLSPAEVVTATEVQARNIGASGHGRYLAPPLRIDGGRIGESHGVPRIGRDTAAVFGGLGVDHGELARLQADGVLTL